MQKPKKKWRRRLAGLASIALVASVALTILSTRLGVIAEGRFEKLITSASDGLYRAEIEEVRVNLLTGNLTLSVLDIRLDSTVFERLKLTSQLPPVTFEGVIPRATARVNTWQLLFSERLRPHEIRISNADLRMCQHAHPTVPPAKPVERKKATMDIESMVVENMRCAYSAAEGEPAWRIDSCDLLLKDVLFDFNGMYTAQETSLRAGSLLGFTTDSLNVISARNIAYASLSESLEMDDFRYEPFSSERRFYDKTDAQHDLVRIHAPRARLTNFSLTDLKRNGWLTTDTLHLDSLRCSIFNDTLAPVGDTAIKTYPARLLAEAPIGVRIKSMRVKGATVRYTEKDHETGAKAIISFDAVDASIANITNDSSDIARDSLCTGNLTGRIMGGGFAHVGFQLDLSSGNDAFSMYVELARIDPHGLNTLMVPMADVRIESFVLDKFTTSIHGDAYAASGNVEMLYHDLAVNLRGTSGPIEALKARLAVHRDNPQKNGEVRVATQIRQSRLPTKSFFNLTWKVMFEGIKEIALRSKWILELNGGLVQK
jgi:hypothetical protein